MSLRSLGVSGSRFRAWVVRIDWLEMGCMRVSSKCSFIGIYKFTGFGFGCLVLSVQGLRFRVQRLAAWGSRSNMGRAPWLLRDTKPGVLGLRVESFTGFLHLLAPNRRTQQNHTPEQ